MGGLLGEEAFDAGLEKEGHHAWPIDEVALDGRSQVGTDGFRKPGKPTKWREKTSQAELGSWDGLGSGATGKLEG